MSTRLVLVALVLLGSRSGQAADASRVVRKAVCLEEEARPRGWPHLSSSQEVLAPFLACTSPAELIELQRSVDMARVVEELDAWSAVRLGSLGPMRAGAAEVLNRKRSGARTFRSRGFASSMRAESSSPRTQTCCGVPWEQSRKRSKEWRCFSNEVADASGLERGGHPEALL